jgi:hypothetical protein
MPSIRPGRLIILVSDLPDGTLTKWSLGGAGQSIAGRATNPCFASVSARLPSGAHADSDGAGFAQRIRVSGGLGRLLAAPRQTRISVGDLAPRDRGSTERELQQTLKRLGAGESAPCLADCDCQIGLICRNGACTSDW